MGGYLCQVGHLIEGRIGMISILENFPFGYNLLDRPKDIALIPNSINNGWPLLKFIAFH